MDKFKDAIIKKDPFIYECWHDGSEHYRCFWCDCTFEEYTDRKGKRQFTKPEHANDCIYLGALENE